MGFLSNLYHQVFTTKRLAKQLAHDPDYLDASELYSIEPNQRVRAVRPAIGFVLAMHATYQTILRQERFGSPRTDRMFSFMGLRLTQFGEKLRQAQFRSEDDKWTLLIFSRTRLTQFGEKTIDGAAARLERLKQDLADMGRPRFSLTELEKFIEVCATCHAIESYELVPGGLPTAVSKAQLALLIPRVFKSLKLRML